MIIAVTVNLSAFDSSSIGIVADQMLADFAVDGAVSAIEIETVAGIEAETVAAAVDAAIAGVAAAKVSYFPTPNSKYLECCNLQERVSYFINVEIGFVSLSGKQKKKKKLLTH